ncbi:MAG: hypothetical protein GX295_07565 [Syntrophomonadaceae bacterium]|nr:hypothetical protein [Syntrophomonadaceae bacterium]
MAGNSPINEIIGHLFNAGGKKIRPTLVFLSASFQPYDRESLIDTAAAVELIHMASLIHDDIIDTAAQRRGQETINHKWNNLTAVLTGDFLFATAFNRLTVTGNYPVLLLLCQSIQQMCEGEINQARQTFNYHQSEFDYFKNIYQKTACLFAASCQAGAITACLPKEQITAMEQFGLYLGYAYQIIDDLLDLIGDPQELGKPTGSDLKQGILTLPVLRCLKDSCYGGKLRHTLDRRQISPSELKQFLQNLLHSDAIPYTLECLALMLHRAGAAIGALPFGTTRFQVSQLAERLLAGPILQIQKSLTETKGLALPNYFTSWIHHQEPATVAAGTVPVATVAAWLL